MRLKSQFLIVMTAIAMAVAACSSGKQQQASSKKTVINLASLKAAKGTPEEKAETIALAGERIVYGPGFMHAAKLFDVALEFDPNNVRARMYKALLAPAMDSRGILARIRPAVKKLDSKAQWDFYRSVSEMPEGDLKSFLLDGQEDIGTEKDIQAFVRVIQNDLRETRKIMGELSNQKITVHAQVPVTDVSAKDIARECQVQKVSEDLYYAYQCDIYTRKDVTLEYGDWEALRLGIAATQVYYTLWNAYDLTGFERIAKKLEGVAHPTEQQVITLVKREADFGKLVDVQTLQEVLDLGAEGVQAVKYAVKYQGALCPFGIPSANVRPGKLFSDGLCVDSGAIRALPSAEAALRGPVAVAFDIFKSVSHHYSYGDGNEWTWYERVKAGQYNTSVDVTKFLNGSATDLKTLLPTQFDTCGNSTNLPDTSLAGVFPNGDAVTALQASNPDFLKKPCVREY